MKRSREIPPNVEQRLGTSEAQYRTLVENPNLGVFLMDCQGNYLFVNSKMQEMTGYTPEDFVSNRRIGFTITHPEDYAVGMRAFRHAILGRASQHNEFRLMHRNGEARWTAAACYPVVGDDGKVSAVQVVIQDITDRKQAEEALARETALGQAEAAIRLRIARMQQNRDLIDVVGEVSDQIGHLGIVHDACSIQIVNADVTDFISCSNFHDRERMIAQLDSLRSMAWEKQSDNMTSHPWVGEVFETGTSRYDPDTDELSKLAGRMSVVDVAFSHGTLAINRRQTNAFSDETVTALERLAGVLSEGFHRFIDLMRQEQLEEQLRESQKMEALGHLVTGVSHNFNNMLMVVLGNLSIAQSEMPKSEHIDAAVDAGKRAAEIIEELMLYSRRSETRKELNDVQEIVRQAVTFCDRTFDDPIKFSVSVRGMLPDVYCHSGKIQQVVVNLCLNARDSIEAAAVDAPLIEVTLDQIDIPRLPDRIREGNSTRHLRLTICDNGLGMDDQTRTRIFEPFFTTKDVGSGTGLGLSTAYAIVHDHGGWIDVESEPGHGARFSICLPAAEKMPTPNKQQEGETTPILAEGQTVLVVDDDDAVRRILRRILERAGYAVLDCADGSAALDLVGAADHKIDLVLLDISMPGISGKEVLEHLAADNPELPVVILTGQNIDDDELAAANAVINKPVFPEDLLQIVGHTIHSRGST